MFWWDEAGDVKANVTLQMTVLYVLIALILLSAETLGWAPHIRFFNLVPLTFVSLSILELSRILAALVPGVPSYRMYLHLIPSMVIVVIFREARMVCSLLFFACTTVIYMQIGDERSAGTVRLLGFTILYIVSYVAALVFSSEFYTDSSGLAYRSGRVLDSPIDWGEEVTYCVSVLLLGSALQATSRFIHLYARSVASHQQEVSQLKAELESFTRSAVEVDTPISRVLAILARVRDQARPSLRDEQESNETRNARVAMVSQINEVLAILAAGALYDPEIREDADTAVSSWVRETTEMTLRGGNGQGSDGGRGRGRGGVGGVRVGGGGHVEGGEGGEGGGEGFRRERVEPMTPDEMWGMLVASAPELDTGHLVFKECLRMVDSWNMDIFEFNEVSGGHALLMMGMVLLYKQRVFSRFQVDERVVLRYLSTVESGYVEGNPYHNAIHAADVTHAFHVLCQSGGVGYFLSELDMFAGIIACLVHDFGHPGVNNNFLVAVGSPLAIRYNDRSVLEFHHCAAAYALLADPRLNIFASLDSGARSAVRSTITTMVLATDMAKHFELISKFNAQLPSLMAEAASGSFESADSKLLALSLVVKCCDISNPARPWHISTQWSDRVMEEGYRQGDREAALGLKVSTFMSRSAPALDFPKNQVGFISIFVHPLFSAVAKLFPRIAFAVQQVESNRGRWDRKREELEVRSARLGH